ncbi:hypothetical protein [Streptomyces sp. MUM 178J]|uniref:hypothetical protein n=1 Tax=Streptomyces sp. MUM 178J TaxID=2791991 RepID=UPI001F03CE24|nr:hypothetical protein [Streptomyces sp. MUM 178J]WRQ81568.1 hypothetical protein I3F59_020660 [Streptomyces sp. MUM 178J]
MQGSDHARRLHRRRVGAAVLVTAVVLLLGACGEREEEPSRAAIAPASAEFCAASADFGIVEQQELTAEERVTKLKMLGELAPEALHDDFHLLVHSAEEPEREVADEERSAGTRVGQYIEESCGTNLPGVRADPKARSDRGVTPGADTDTDTDMGVGTGRTEEAGEKAEERGDEHEHGGGEEDRH